MSVLADFFRGAGTQLGIFAPRDHLVALFADYRAAHTAERTLLDAGFRHDEVIAVPGSDVVDLLRDNAKHTGLGKLLMQELSRMFETEEVYAEHDLQLASRGAGFLAVYAPNENRKREVWRLIEPVNPIVARHYSLTGVEHLTGET